MKRRDFLTNAAIATTTMALRSNPSMASASVTASASEKWRGVNLGGWLALEKWITRSVYAGVQAEDEYTLCEKLGKAKATERLKQHRQKWITAEDFDWLKARGINVVRIPVNYGIAEENPPFITGVETLDWAFSTAKKHGIGVVLDLHGVPGSQNAWDHSGREGTLGWHTSKENIDHSLRIVSGLASLCKNYDNLVGFELLNEPRWDVPLQVIKQYYQDAYRKVREHLPKEKCAVVIHDAFRPRDWANFMSEPEYQNVILDTHCYQCFTDDDRKRDAHAQVQHALVERKKLLDEMQRQLPTIVGEWSCALPPESLRGRAGVALDLVMRAYGDAELINFDATRGWFFWTLKTEEGGAWSFRDCVLRGWLPENFSP